MKANNAPLISVIISTYNGKKEWLCKALDSVYNQTYQNFEFIIINDCSTNNIEDTIKEYIEKHSNIIYIKNKENLWLTKSLNIGIENSHWKYIARIDDDDYWVSIDKLEKQVEFMENNIDYWICWAGETIHIDENDEILYKEIKKELNDNQIRNRILQTSCIYHSSALIRKSALDEVWYYDPTYIFAQDHELWLRIWLKYKFKILKNVCIAYRTNSKWATSKNLLKQRILWIKLHIKYWKHYPNSKKALLVKLLTFFLPRKLKTFIRKLMNPRLIQYSSWNNNVLILNYEFPPIGGWAAPVSYDISKWYVNAWYNVDVITMKFKDFPEYENKDWINIYRVKCIRHKKEICYPYEQLTYLISWYFKAKKLLKQKKYNVCHCHFLIPSGILALLLKKRFWLKYFVTSHGSDVPGYNPNRFKFAHKLTPNLLKKIINNSESVITPSKYLADLIHKNIKWINKNVEIIPNWIDTNEFIPLEKEKIIVWAWRLWPLKWLHLLTEAFSEIENTKWFELHICGDWPLMDNLKEIQSKSKNKIILHWWIDNKSKEYKNLFWKAMIFCLPSVSENGPVSILEWMSSWCCILTTDSTGCLEMTKWIWQYVKHDVESIKKQLEYLINHPHICERLWKKSRIKAINNYDKNNTIWKYIKLCKKYL